MSQSDVARDKKNEALWSPSTPHASSVKHSALENAPSAAPLHRRLWEDLDTPGAAAGSSMSSRTRSVSTRALSSQSVARGRHSFACRYTVARRSPPSASGGSNQTPRTCACRRLNSDPGEAQYSSAPNAMAVTSTALSASSLQWSDAFASVVARAGYPHHGIGARVGSSSASHAGMRRSPAGGAPGRQRGVRASAPSLSVRSRAANSCQPGKAYSSSTEAPPSEQRFSTPSTRTGARPPSRRAVGGATATAQRR
mmetsp:Transcript_9938/g.41106  ORF Transcript_9938/g.41106 Transcript_9938/m.41106 type:complete len:254 (-) Transcript_9938:446-1207(-)